MPASKVWQGLKFASPDDRARIAALWGAQAKAVSRDAPAIEQFVYEGQTYDVGRSPHWHLMARACRAKFSQNAEARAALEATGDRPLTHRVRNDSETIPGVIIADILGTSSAHHHHAPKRFVRKRIA